jgi:putative acetyltransferase
MKIRAETPADYAAIRDIHIAAFAKHPFSRQTEHLIVEALRESDALTIGLVAVDEKAAVGRPSPEAALPQTNEGAVVGHIAFSPAKIDGKDCGWFMLGPIGVEPKRQRQGIGRALVKEGLRQLRDLGAEGCVLVGDPAYYTRLGFQHHPSLTMAGVPAEVILSLPLSEHVPQGEVTHHVAFTAGL